MVRNYRRSTKGRYTVSADPTAQTDRYVDAGDPLAERASVIQRLLVENLLRVCGGAKNVGNLCVIRKTVVKLAVLLLLAAAPAFCQAVALTWAPGTVNAGYTATVTGYNVYRCVGSCPPTVGAGWSQIATGITQLAYTDVGPLTDGSTYNYAVTTIDAAGDESAFSPIFSGVPTGNDVYIAQAAAGGNTGADCADAYAASYFNNSANWTSGTPTGTQIGPGTTVYLCGSFSYGAGTSGALQFQGSGTSGNPIAVVFEPGASATSPNWGPNGFIYASGLSYIAVNGGTNGSITATATGTGLTYSNLTQTSGITFSNVSNSQITGLSISNIYVHTATPTDENGSGSSWGIQWAGGNNITINNNTVHDAYGCIDYYPTSTPSSGVYVYGNNAYNCNWSVAVREGSGTYVLNAPVLIYGNTLHDWILWDDNADNNHHDGVFLSSANYGSSINGAQVYGNWIYGAVDSFGMSGFIYNSGENSSTNNWGNANGTWIYNNVLNVTGETTYGPSDGLIYDVGNGSYVFNNTTVGACAVSGCGNGYAYQNGTSGATPPVAVANNIWMTAYVGEDNTSIPSTTVLSDYNDFWNLHTVVWTSTLYYQYLSNVSPPGWQQASSNDAHSTSANPQLNASSSPPYQPTSSTPAAVLAGENLTSYCSTAAGLCTDALGYARPSTGSWTMGAFQYTGSAPAPVLVGPAVSIFARAN